MWPTIGKLLVQAAIWCLGHHDEIAKVVTTIKDAKDKEQKNG